MTRSAFFTGPKSLFDAAAMMPDGAVMPRDQAQALIEKVVKMSKADEISINVTSGYQADLRFAANQVSTSGGVVNGQVGIQSTFGKKHAAAVTNDLSAASLRRSAVRSRCALCCGICADRQWRRSSRSPPSI